ncbi:MAG: L,D-transpeptidase [Myxococcales bacterium]|nr:L,D-transpeptidase [Myxococcales bacterium]
MRLAALGLLVVAIALVSCGDGAEVRQQPAPEPQKKASTPTAEEKSTEAKPRERAPKPIDLSDLRDPFPLHGIATYFQMNVYRETEQDDNNVRGSLRRGSRFRARMTDSRRGCSAGWVELEAGGYVCSGRGNLVDKIPPVVDDLPVFPALGSALPYAYGYTVRNDVPQYWTVPDRNAEIQAIEAIKKRRQWEAEKREELAAMSDADAGIVLPPETLEEAPPLPEHLRLPMLKGFYVSLDRVIANTEDTEFLRTVRGAHVKRADLLMNEPPTSRGVVLAGEWQLPLAFVWRRGARGYTYDIDSRTAGERIVLERQSAYRVEDPRFVHDDQPYVLTKEGVLAHTSSVHIVEAVSRPATVPENARWIHIDLETQSLVAYEGDLPVFATLVSTGKEGFGTPPGLFRIHSKYVSTTMDDMAGDEPYSIEDVPWTMYFHGNFAIHGAFWHYTFGRVRSHGCVNVSPIDARWLFFWATPSLPPEWHSIQGTLRDEATYVFVDGPLDQTSKAP